MLRVEHKSLTPRGFSLADKCLAVNEFTSLLHLVINYNCKKTRGSGTVDEQLPHHYKVKGSGPTTAAGTGREEIAEEKVQL